jgi:S1-C subfamily serine protease
MASPDAQRGGRETRLLLVTIAVSIGVLLLLSRFRFPERAAEPMATPAAAPLERLAARAAYDELSSTMVDLERRLADTVAVLPVQPPRESGGFVVAPRLTPDRAVTILRGGETLPADTAGASRVIANDLARELAVVAVRPAPDAMVTPRSGPPRPGPRYVVAVEGSADGLTLRPVYVGRTSTRQDERHATPLLAFSGVQPPVVPGSAIFSLDGIFIGLVIDAGATTAVLPGEFLKGMADSAVPSGEQPAADLGIQVEPLTEALKRATSAASGVIVTTVDATGPAAAVLFPGDVILAIDDTPIGGVSGFRAAERTRVPGREARLSVLRRREPQTVTVTAADARATPQVRTLDEPGIVGRTAAGAGIEIVTVHPDSPAERAGLLAGDVIATIDGRPAGDLGDLGRAFRSAPPGTAWILTAQRGQRTLALALEKR